MPTIETRRVKSTRKDHICVDCNRTIPKGSSATATFGMAHEGEKAWWAYWHPKEVCPSYAWQRNAGPVSREGGGD